MLFHSDTNYRRPHRPVSNQADLMTREGRRGEYQPEVTVSVGMSATTRSIIASAPETNGSWLKPTRGRRRPDMPRCLYGTMTLMVFMAIPAPGQKRNPDQSKGEDFLGAYSSLCLRLFCPGDFRGCWGDGGKSPEGPDCDEHLARPGKSHRDSHHNWSISTIVGPLTVAKSFQV